MKGEPERLAAHSWFGRAKVAATRPLARPLFPAATSLCGHLQLTPIVLFGPRSPRLAHRRESKRCFRGSLIENGIARISIDHVPLSSCVQKCTVDKPVTNNKPFVDLGLTRLNCARPSISREGSNQDEVLFEIHRDQCARCPSICNDDHNCGDIHGRAHSGRHRCFDPNPIPS
jgi:hypothetical protein